MRLIDHKPPARLAGIKTDECRDYAAIVETARAVVKTSGRFPLWFGVDRQDALVEQIIGEALEAEVENPVKGKWLRKRVTKIARRIIHGEWDEERWIETDDGKEVRRSKSTLRIVDPRAGREEGTVDGDATETSEGKNYIYPLNSVGVDVGGRLSGLDPVYQGGSLCGYHATPKYKNVVEDRMIAKIDRDRAPRDLRLRQFSQSQIDFMEWYVENRRQGKSFSVAERVQFLRLTKRCNVEAEKTVIECRAQGRVGSASSGRKSAAEGIEAPLEIHPPALQISA
jgi:hypothetical protein